MGVKLLSIVEAWPWHERIYSRIKWTILIILRFSGCVQKSSKSNHHGNSRARTEAGDDAPSLRSFGISVVVAAATAAKLLSGRLLVWDRYYKSLILKASAVLPSDDWFGRRPFIPENKKRNQHTIFPARRCASAVGYQLCVCHSIGSSWFSACRLP